MAQQAPELRAARPSDLPEILALLRQCELLEAGVAEAIDDFLVAHSDGQLVGCSGLEVYGNLGLLRSVAVAPAARNLGLGRRLVDGIVAFAEGRRLRELHLLTTTAPRFFERLGFVSTPRSSVPAGIAGSWEFKAGCPRTALLMRLDLGNHHV